MTLNLDVVAVVLLAVVLLVVLAAYRALARRLAHTEVLGEQEGERRRVALTDARDALRARTSEMELLRSEWHRDVEVRFPDEGEPALTINGLPCDRGLRGCDFEAVREALPGQPSATVLYLRLPSAPEAPR